MGDLSLQAASGNWRGGSNSPHSHVVGFLRPKAAFQGY